MNVIKQAVRKININLSKLNYEKKTIAFVTPDDVMPQCTVIANMAIMYGQADQKTIIIDTDFAHNYFSETFKIQNRVGLFNYLGERNIPFDQLVNEIPGQNVDVILAGEIRDDESSEIIGDQRFTQLIKKVSKEYAHVLINTSRYVSDVELGSLFSEIDGIIIVNNLGETPKPKMRSLVASLRKSNVLILGYVSAQKM